MLVMLLVESIPAVSVSCRQTVKVIGLNPTDAEQNFSHMNPIARPAGSPCLRRVICMFDYYLRSLCIYHWMYEAVVSITIYSKIKTSCSGVRMYIAVVARERNHGSMMIR